MTAYNVYDNDDVVARRSVESEGSASPTVPGGTGTAGGRAEPVSPQTICHKSRGVQRTAARSGGDGVGGDGGGGGGGSGGGHRSFKANKCYIKTAHNSRRHPAADISIVPLSIIVILSL